MAAAPLDPAPKANHQSQTDCSKDTGNHDEHGDGGWEQRTFLRPDIQCGVAVVGKGSLTSQDGAFVCLYDAGQGGIARIWSGNAAKARTTHV